MRKLYRCLFLLSTLVLAGGMWSCSDDDDETESVVITQTSTDETSEVYATSATFKLATRGVESFAYQVVEGADATAPAGEVIYAEAQENNIVISAEDGDNEVTVYGLEGNKTYTVFFALKKGAEYIVKSQTITTPAYTRLITVIDTKPYSIKLHIEMPENTYYKLSFGARDMYQAQKDQFGMTDGDYVSYGQLYKGAKTINLVDGEYLEENPVPDEDFPIQVLPGYPYVILVAECDADGNVLCEYDYGDGGDDWEPMKTTRSATAPMTDGYTEECSDAAVTFNGKYAKQYVYGGSTLVESKITVEKTKITERSATFTITPDENVVTYVVDAMTKEDYDYYVTICGERGIPTFELTNNEMYTGSQVMSTNPAYLPFEKGKTYKLIVVGTYSEDYSVQSIQIIDFTPFESTKPEAKLEITVKEDPDKNPWMVWFNIKAPDKNCSYIRYLMNYMKEWTPMLNSGTTKEQLMQSYGNYVTEVEIMNAINSNDGYDIGFTSWEHTESMLMVASFNEDEKMAVYEGKSTSLPEPDKERVDSPLFDDLKGDWTATCQAQWQDYTGTYDQKVSFKVTLAGGPEQGPSSVSAMDSKDYDALFSYFKESAMKNGQDEATAEAYAKTKVAELFDEYKSEATRYAGKYRGQNRLVGLRFDAAHEYMSAWDLFCDLDYSAYDTEELFYDYGPKLFLEISKGENGKDKLELTADQSCVAPVSAWKNYEVLFVGYNSAVYDNAPLGHFPVTVSSDKNTITIGGVEADDVMCYPSPAYYSFVNQPVFISKITSPITLTRGWTEPEKKMAPIAKALEQTTVRAEMVASHKGNRFMRTSLPWTKDGLLPLMPETTIKSISLKENIQKKAAELHTKMPKK